jgi:hypothetical protein
VPGVLWQQAIITFLAALVASWVSLLYRFRNKGRPFGSKSAVAWSITIIFTLASVATMLGLALPRAAEKVPPVSLGLFLPAFLCAGPIRKPDSPIDRAAWYGIATIGLSLLLDQLQQQMDLDRDKWCELRVGDHWSLEELDDAALRLCSKLSNRISDGGLRTRLKSDYDAVHAAVIEGEQATEARERRRAIHDAQQALTMMLGRAYEWGYRDVSVTPRRRTVSARRTRAGS